MAFLINNHLTLDEVRKHIHWYTYILKIPPIGELNHRYTLQTDRLGFLSQVSVL